MFEKKYTCRQLNFTNFLTQGGIRDKEMIIASVEIKTRFSRAKINAAKACAREFGGKRFRCTVSDDRWWRAVPQENRGQVIQQAAVLGLDWVLFVVATEKELIMECLVHVPTAARNAYMNALAKWRHLMSWALDSLHTSGPPPVPPRVIDGEEVFSEEDAYILSTHIRLWRAIRKKITAAGRPLHPVYVVKAAVQVCTRRGR